LTRGPEKRPVALTIWATRCEGGRIVCRPHVVTGPVRLCMGGAHELPPEWLERTIPLSLEPEEDAPCR
jgi:hypothetical protein